MGREVGDMHLLAGASRTLRLSMSRERLQMSCHELSLRFTSLDFGSLSLCSLPPASFFLVLYYFTYIEHIFVSLIECVIMRVRRS